MRESDRAVSDMIAFVIVFSLIITSVGITYTYGYSTLTDYQEDEQKRNAERAFVALSNNIGDMEGRHIEGRSGELRLAGGTISVEKDTEITVEAPSWSMPTRTAGALTYEFEDTRIEYENGAVFRRDGDNRRVMLSEPEYQCTDSHATVSVLTLDAPNSAGLSSDGTVQVIGKLEKRYLHYPQNRTGTNSTSVDNVRVTVDSSSTEAWEEYFNENGWDVSASGSSITAKCEPSSGQIDLYVRETRIDITFIN